MSHHLDPDSRAVLHAKLDAILDTREQLEAEAEVDTSVSALPLLGNWSYANLATTEVAPKATALLKEAASLVADATGVPLRCAALQMPAADGSQQRAALRAWLEVLMPILDLPYPTALGGPGFDCLAEHTVWLGLRALDAGEVWPIFEPGKRGNRPANLYSLSIARLSALEWKRRLLSMGLSEGDSNRKITDAFGEQWDTIRKWEPSCSQTLGRFYVGASLQRAEHDEKSANKPRGLFGFLREPWPTRLERAGTTYRSEKQRAAELSPAKRKAARRAEKQSG